MGKPPIAAQTVSGPINRVPCPHCGKPNDFTTLDHLLVDSNESLGEGDPGGHNTFSCDHCNKEMRVVSVKRITTVFVRQVK